MSKPNMVFKVEVELVKGSGRWSEMCKVKTLREMKVKHEFYSRVKGYEVKVTKIRA